MAKPTSVPSASSFIIWIALACIICMSAKAPFALAQVQCSVGDDSPSYEDAEHAVEYILEHYEGVMCAPLIWPWYCGFLATNGTATVLWCASATYPCTDYGKGAKEILAKCRESVNGRDVVAGNNTWERAPLPPFPSRHPYVEIRLSNTDVLSSVV